MKRIAYLTFYFQPDLSAGSFRNSSLAIELAKQALEMNVIVDVYTTMPNRYSTYETSSPEFEELGNLKIYRISLPSHKSGMLGQVFSFRKFYLEVLRLNTFNRADLVFASSGRLFTAFLGYKIASKSNATLYLDIRDIFVDTMSDVFKSKLLKMCIMPVLKLIERKTFNYSKHINLISGGFKDYFSKFRESNFTFHTNGIDDEFLFNNKHSHSRRSLRSKITIVYAGNIGEGQGLHKIIPQAAKELGNNYEFLIIGDGGTKKLLEVEIQRLKLTNVILQKPVMRKDLSNIYQESDYLFLHLNDYQAFQKVLPSKIFELATINRPIIAGVSGYAANFIKSEIPESYVFEPCQVNKLVTFLKGNIPSNDIDRVLFKEKYKRSNINSELAKSILSYL